MSPPAHNIITTTTSPIEQLVERGNEDNFLSLYKRYVSTNTEAPTLFHIWSAISGVAAALGKNFWFTRGHFRVYPNLYIVLIGSPGTGKGTCINILQNLMLGSGYRTIAADRSSKEKFLIDLDEGFTFSEEEEIFKDAQRVLNVADFLSMPSTGSAEDAKEVYIIAEEFNDFIGTNNQEFVSLLTKLWSYEGVYRSRLKNSRSVSINNPCINILGGTTSAGFAIAFPPEIIGQGLLARLLPIYGEPTGRKITFPEKPDEGIRTSLTDRLRGIRENVVGEATIERDARGLLEKIHQTWKPHADGRFQHYATRRFDQLVKICLVAAAFRTSTEIIAEDVRNANTILSHTEELMPKAIGEFGKAKNADVTSKIMEMLWTTSKPLTSQDLWKSTMSDLNQFSDLANILSNLQHGEKIQRVTITNEEGRKEVAWLPKHAIKDLGSEFINNDLKKGLL